MEDFLKSLKVVVLKRLCSVYDITGKTKKRDIIDALCEENLEVDEIKEQLEEWNLDEQRERERLEREQEQINIEREKMAHEREMARLNVEQQRALERGNGGPNIANPETAVHVERSFNMAKFLQPFKEDGDITLFLVNFERVCTQMGFPRESWSLRLMTVLHPNAAEVIARMSENDSQDYDKAKDKLLQKYRLTAEEFRSKFRKYKKNQNEGFTEYAYRLRTNFDEWVRIERVANDYEKLAQLISLEQFYSTLSDELKFWVQDRNKEATLENAAKLADDYVAKRGHRSENSFSGKTPLRNGGPRKYLRREYNDSNKNFHRQNLHTRDDEQKGKATSTSNSNSEKNESNKPNANVGNTNKHFEKRRAIKCYNCGGPHFAFQCDRPKIAFACLESSPTTDKLLEPYLMEAKINGREGLILRDSAATFDVVSKDMIASEDFTGKSVHLRAALSDENVCLPVARVKLISKLGEIETEAAVTTSLPAGYPYLLSNRTWQKLENQKPAEDEVHVVQALTRAMAKKIQFESEKGKEVKAESESVCEPGDNDVKGVNHPEAGQDKPPRKRGKGCPQG